MQIVFIIGPVRKISTFPDADLVFLQIITVIDYANAIITAARIAYMPSEAGSPAFKRLADRRFSQNGYVFDFACAGRKAVSVYIVEDDLLYKSFAIGYFFAVDNDVIERYVLHGA